MAMQKTGARYPLAIISSFTYKCSSSGCKFNKTIPEGDEAGVCESCGCKLRLVSSHTENTIKS